MKKVSIFALIALGGLSMGMASCSKEDPATPLEINAEQTATINGKILINKDENTATPKWAAPANVQIIATVPYSQLNSSASGTYTIKNVSYNATTGEFAIVAPVSANGSVITVKFADFKGEVVVPTVVNGTPSTETIKVIWNSKTANSNNLVPGEVYNLPTWELNGAADYTIDNSVGDDI